MLWQVKARRALPVVVWVCLVLAVAAYGSVVVRNLTDMLIGAVDHTRSFEIATRPSR